MPPVLIHTQGLDWVPDPPLDESSPHPLGSRFYVKLYPPASSPNKQPTRYPIPYAGITKGVLRLNLCPCTHSGVNGSYKAEYWESRPMYPTNRGLTIKDRLVREEYWHIPFGDCLTRKIELLRSDVCTFQDNVDLLPYPESLSIIQIVKVYSEVDWLYYTLEEFSPPGLIQLGLGRPIEHIGISWGTIKPRTGVRYFVEYLKPYTLCDILNSPSNFWYQSWNGPR